MEVLPLSSGVYCPLDFLFTLNILTLTLVKYPDIICILHSIALVTNMKIMGIVRGQGKMKLNCSIMYQLALLLKCYLFNLNKDIVLWNK